MLKTNFATAFAEAATDVLATYLEKPAKTGRPTEVADPQELQEVAVIIGITGGMEGRLVLELDTACALRVCEAMNFGEPFDSLNPMARSTLAELANLIAGRAVTLLNDNGSAFSITPPVILCGIGMRASGVLSSTVIIPIDTELGRLMVNIALREHR